MKLSGRTQMFPRYSLLDSLIVIKSLGFDGVEICVEKLDWSFHDLKSLPISEIRERLAELELQPYCFSFHQDYIFNDEIFALTKDAIRLAPALGTKLFIFGGTKKRDGDSVEWNLMIQRTRELVDVATECGVVLAEEFEPNFIVGSTADLLRLFEEIPTPYLAANLDLGHLFLCDPDPLESIRQVGQKIVHCHISNMPGGLHDHVLPQEGDMDLLAYLQRLNSVGFTGAMALDMYKYDYEAVASESIAFLRGLISTAMGHQGLQ